MGHLTTFSFLAGLNLGGGSKYRYSMLGEGKLNALLPGTVRTSLTMVIKLLSWRFSDALEQGPVHPKFSCSNSIEEARRGMQADVSALAPWIRVVFRPSIPLRGQARGALLFISSMEMGTGLD